MKQTILVTGAAGFMGSFLCDELVRHGYCVVGIDNFFRGSRENIQQLSQDLHFRIETIDLSLPEAVARVKQIILAERISVVFHLAAINGTQYFYDRPLFVFDQNITITQHLISAIDNTPVKHIIYTSSSEVYGDAWHIPTEEDSPILLHENFDRDSYAASKATDEFYIHLFAKSTSISALILRVFNLYGPRMVGTRYGQVIPEFITRILSDSPFTMIGHGEQTRSFCYVKDAVSMMRQLMEQAIDGVLNLGHDEEITMLALAKTLHALMHRPFNPVFLPPRVHDHPRRCPDLHYLRSLLPDAKHTPFIQGLQKTINFYAQRVGK